MIDFLLVIALLLIVFSLVYVFLPSSIIKTITADKTQEIQYSVEILGVDKEFLQKIKENDTVLDSVSKSKLGTVTAVDYSTPYKQFEYNEEENAGVLSAVEGKYNVIVTISATAKFKDGEGYTVDGVRIAVGEKINARFPDYSCEGYCIGVPRN